MWCLVRLSPDRCEKRTRNAEVRQSDQLLQVEVALQKNVVDVGLTLLLPPTGLPRNSIA